MFNYINLFRVHILKLHNYGAEVFKFLYLWCYISKVNNKEGGII